MSRDSG